MMYEYCTGLKVPLEFVGVLYPLLTSIDITSIWEWI